MKKSKKGFWIFICPALFAFIVSSNYSDNYGNWLFIYRLEWSRKDKEFCGFG